MGVQGFPTLKIVRPGAKTGKPVVEDYQGPRTASGIVDAVVEKINNHVKRVSDKDFDSFLSTGNDTAKVILFTEKGTTTALLKSIAIDFLGSLSVAQVRNTQKKAVETFGIEKYPTLVLLPGGDKDGIVYDGEMKKEAIVKFLSQAASPNPDPSAKDKAKKAKSTPKKAKTSDTSDKPATATDETTPDESAEDPTVEKPVIWEGPLPIPAIQRREKLVKECLSPKSTTCVLAFVPKERTAGDASEKALTSLAELAHKHSLSKRKLFPFFEINSEEDFSKDLIKALDLSEGVQVIAINARRGWWRRYEGVDFGHEGIEGWIDQIRLSEGIKKKLPEGIVAIAIEEVEPSAAASEATPEASSEPTPVATDSEGTETTATPEPEITPDAEVISDSVTEPEPSSEKGADPTEAATATPDEHDEL